MLMKTLNGYIQLIQCRTTISIKLLNSLVLLTPSIYEGLLTLLQSITILIILMSYEDFYEGLYSFCMDDPYIKDYLSILKNNTLPGILLVKVTGIRLMVFLSTLTTISTILSLKYMRIIRQIIFLI